MSIHASSLRLKRTLTEAQRLLDVCEGYSEGKFVENNSGHARLMKCVRRLGFLLSLVKLQLNSVDDDVDLESDAAADVLRRGEIFLANMLSAHIPPCGVPLSCVGAMGRVVSPCPLFHVDEPFFIIGDHGGSSEAVRVFPCALHRDEGPMPPAPSPRVPATTSEETAQAQVVADIRGAIRSMKEGVARMSDIMQQERRQLDANAELLERGVLGVSSQSGRMDQLGGAFKSGPAPPRFFGSVPGAGMFWHAVVVPLWVVIKQAVFLVLIVSVTVGMMLLMLTAPKTYVYVR